MSSIRRTPVRPLAAWRNRSKILMQALKPRFAGGMFTSTIAVGPARGPPVPLLPARKSPVWMSARSLSPDSSSRHRAFRRAGAAANRFHVERRTYFGRPSPRQLKQPPDRNARGRPRQINAIEERGEHAWNRVRPTTRQRVAASGYKPGRAFLHLSGSDFRLESC